MKRRGMLFVGLDVIGDYLTEVNVTSPTCIRELDAQFGLNIAGDAVRCDRGAAEPHECTPVALRRTPTRRGIGEANASARPWRCR